MSTLTQRRRECNVVHSHACHGFSDSRCPTWQIVVDTWSCFFFTKPIIIMCRVRPFRWERLYAEGEKEKRSSTFLSAMADWDKGM